MNVSTLFIRVHSSTMRHTWGLKHEETTRIKQGNNTFYMRRWLRLHVVQPIILSYPLPMSMLSPGGINCNNEASIITKRGYCYNWYLLVKACTRVKGMTMWLAAPHIVSVSTSCSRCCYLMLSLWSSCVVLMYTLLFYYELIYIV